MAPVAPYPPSAGLVSSEPWQDISYLPARYRTTVNALKDLVAARTMEQHWDAAEHLDVEVVWDVPPVYLQGRDPMRLVVYALKWLGHLEFQPWMFRLTELDQKRAVVQLLLQAHIMPHRPWYLPVTWLLPKELNLQVVETLRISKGGAADGSRDVMTRVEGVMHNLPKLPTLLRMVNGALLGYLPAATEAVWSPLVGLTGDPSYRNRPEEHPSLLYRATKEAQARAAAAADAAAAATASAAETAKGAAVSAANRTAGAADSAAGMVERTAGGPTNGSGGVVGSVKGAAVSAAGAVRDAVGGVAESVKQGAEAGAARVGEAVGKGKKAAAGY